MSWYPAIFAGVSLMACTPINDRPPLLGQEELSKRISSSVRGMELPVPPQNISNDAKLYELTATAYFNEWHGRPIPEMTFKELRSLLYQAIKNSSSSSQKEFFEAAAPFQYDAVILFDDGLWKYGDNIASYMIMVLCKICGQAVFINGSIYNPITHQIDSERRTSLPVNIRSILPTIMAASENARLAPSVPAVINPPSDYLAKISPKTAQ